MAKSMMQAWLVAIVMLLMVVCPVRAQPPSFDGSYVYDASYKALLDYDGFYYSDIMKYSDLSTQNAIQSTMFIVEKPNAIVTWSANYTFLDAYGSNHTLITGRGIDQTKENGFINASVSYHFANGTIAMEKYSQYYEFLLNPDPMYFFVYLQKGDTALVNVFKANETTNITRLQIVRDVATPVVTKVQLPSLETMAGVFAGIVSVEGEIIADLSVFVKIFLMLGMIVIVPTLMVLTISWAVKKVKEQVKGD